MNKPSIQAILLALSLCCNCMIVQMNGQDSIKVEDIGKFSYAFDIENGKLVGEGAEILMEAVSDAHVVMLGNNSQNSVQEGDFEIALSKVLNRHSFKNLVVEIGPSSGAIVNDLVKRNRNVVSALRELNQKYKIEIGSSIITPIPDLKNLPAAQLIESVKEQDWSMAALGTDSWTGYKMIFDHIYNNLSVADRKLHHSSYSASVKLIDNLYASMKGQSYDDLAILTKGLKSSVEFNDFIKRMDAYSINKKQIRALNFSIDYWWLFGQREFFKKNRLSSKRNKTLLKNALEGIRFDFENDKLFLKMWRGHLANGVTANGFYGVGNTLKELAEYHGHNGLNIGVLGRYTLVDDEVMDVMENPNKVPAKHQPFISLGQKDKWVLIDLRPFNKEFYWGNYFQTIEMLDMMRSYDMILIPKTDGKAEINY